VFGDHDQDYFVPLMKLGSCLFVSVPSSLRDTHAKALQDAIADRLASERGVRGLVVDVSSLSLIDSFAAKVLGDTAGIASNFGARTVLVGIRPQIATTLVELGIDLAQVDTALTLERALNKLRIRIVDE
jgi:rsbT antagonist protein RsbS